VRNNRRLRERPGVLVDVDAGDAFRAVGEAIRADSAFADGFWQFLRTGDVSVLPDSVVLPEIEWVVPEELEEPAGRGAGGGR
jgi:hypothetical protein